MREVSIEEFRALVGKEMGVSRWFEIDQTRIDEFAKNTEDHQFIHVNSELAAKTPFGGAVVHGFLPFRCLR